MTEKLLTVKNLHVHYASKRFRQPDFHALKNVSLEIAPGECVGLVGESGSGKTTLGRAILGLAPTTGGSIHFDGEDITQLSRRKRRALSASIQVVFQDPYTSLNPAMTVEDILSEPLTAAGRSRKDARGRIAGLLDDVGLPNDSGQRLPREFSGGQRQRVAIARALALDPRLIICDEPVSALDLSTQSLILDLLIELQERTNAAYLFVSHDLEVVRHISHRVAVMYGGEILETGDAAVITSAPRNPYTQRLLLAAPVADPVRQAQRRAARHELIAASSAER
jgi:peptide/nickel transport system ATP-binding protein